MPMPFVNISLARGKSQEYLEGVSRAVHGALVAELGMKPDDDFQLINQHEPNEMVFNRTFRGSPRSDDWIVFAITEGVDRGQLAKRKFYRKLVQLLEAGPEVSPGDVFVMFYATPIINFSFGDGVSAPDIVAIEAFEADQKNPSARVSYHTYEINYALSQLFDHRNGSLILPMLRDDVVLKIPATLSYGGEYHGTKAFGEFFARGIPGGTAVWESFDVHVEQIIEAEGYLAVQLDNRAVPRSTGKAVSLRNLWLFRVTGGRIASAELYADTAAAASLAG
jgi:ketosteroid isomerase-like protein